MVMSDQPVITLLDQDHRETGQGLSSLAASNGAKSVETRRIGNVVIEHDNLAVVDDDFVPASCQAREVAADGLATFLRGKAGRPYKNGVRRVETDQRIHVIGIE